MGRKLWGGFRGLVKQDILAQLLLNCGESKNLIEGRRLRVAILRSEQRFNWLLHNLLIQMYGRCESVTEAQEVFDGIAEPNVYSWNALLTAYAHNGHYIETKRVFDGMHGRNVLSWTVMLQASTRHSDIHIQQAVFEKMPMRTTVSCNAILAAYAENGDLHHAWCVFDTMPEHDVASWTSLIQACSQEFSTADAENAFNRMPLHDDISWNVLISMYARTGDVHETEKMFQKSPQSTVVTWNALLVVYSTLTDLDLDHDFDQALKVYDLMPAWSTVSWTTVLYALATTGHVHEASRMFETVPERGDITWNALLTSLAYNGCLQRAEETFRRAPYHSSISCTAMLTAYARNGHMPAAKVIFNRLQERDVPSWNVIISSACQFGQCGETVELFRLMSLDGTSPDAVTFTSLLVSCSYGGRFHECRSYFLSMPADFLVAYSHEHYACMVDMLARSGQLEAAEDLIKNMPFVPEVAAWSSLLAASKVQRDIRLGERATREVIQQETRESSPYLLLCNTLTL